MAELGQGSAPGASYLLHVVTSLCAGLDEHDAQFFGALLPLLDGYLPADEGRGENQPLVEVEGAARDEEGPPSRARELTRPLSQP